MIGRRWPAACIALFGPVCIARAAAPLPLPEFPSPATTPVAQVRAQFEARAGFRAYDEARAVAESLAGDDPHKVDPGACRSHAAELDAASRHDPLSLAVWYYKSRCADVLGDAPSSRQYETAFLAVLRDMLQGVPPDNGQTPIPLGTMADGVALIDASDETLIYSYIDLRTVADGIVWRVGLRDASGAHERNLSFELLQPRLSLLRSPGLARSPFVRTSTWVDSAKAWRTQAEKPGGLPVTLDALDAGPADQRAARIKQESSDDHLSNAIVLARYCFQRPKQACNVAAVDSLLTFAEQGHAEPMVLLAFAYTRADGLKQDPEAAKALMLGAGRKMGVGAAFQEYFNLDLDFHKKATDFQRWAFQQMVAAADTGDALAAGMALELAGHIEELDTDSARAERYRQQADRAGLGLFSQRYLLIATSKTKDPAARMRITAAIAGSAKRGLERMAAASGLAWAYETGKSPGVPADPVQALRWNREAGMLGDTSSMIAVARHYAGQQNRPDQPDAMELAAEWYSGAVLLGNVEANLEVARLAERDPKGFGIAMPGASMIMLDSKDAVDTYREIDKEMPDSNAGAIARRRLARMMLDGRGTARDPEKARALLTADAEAGDGEAALALASALYAGDFGARDPDGAKRWIDKALVKPDKVVATMFADHLYHGIDLPLDRARSLALWTQAAAQDYPTAWNNMGWELCTATDAAARDPGRGLEAVRHVVSGGDAPAGYVDSLAACQAATGDFDAAVATEQRAIAQLDPVSDTAARMRDRLDLYKAHRVYVQPPEAPAGTAAAPAGHANGAR
ncbi:MAG TPA: hypothetical protein VGH80_09500 [Xanthomonadaceae bacterium]